MKAIIYKIFCYYKRNISELILQIISSLIGVLPIYWMLQNDGLNRSEMQVVVFSYLIAYFISNVMIGVCFEYYRDYLLINNVDLYLSKVSKFQYILIYSIFYVLMNGWIVFVVYTGLFGVNLFAILVSLSMTASLFLIIMTALFIVFLCTVSILLAKIIDRTKMFSMGSLVIGVMLLLSGCYTPLLRVEGWYRVLYYLNPFYYFVGSLQHVLFGIALPMNSGLFVVCNILLLVGYLFIAKLLKINI
ncbi:MAG: ABC transporter permease [Bulleidia sp.]|nr:ABC transporter permease [Bulleidia sp.]